VFQKATDDAAAVEVLRVTMKRTVNYCMKCGEMWHHSSGDCEHLCVPGCDAVQPGRYLLTSRRNVRNAVPLYTSSVSEYSMIGYDITVV
jgi:hypothetical protein